MSLAVLSLVFGGLAALVVIGVAIWWIRDIAEERAENASFRLLAPGGPVDLPYATQVWRPELRQGPLTPGIPHPRLAGPLTMDVPVPQTPVLTGTAPGASHSAAGRSTPAAAPPAPSHLPGTARGGRAASPEGKRSLAAPRTPSYEEMRAALNARVFAALGCPDATSYDTVVRRTFEAAEKAAAGEAS